jgi:thiol:disulfide interchange protein
MTFAMRALYGALMTFSLALVAVMTGVSPAAADAFGPMGTPHLAMRLVAESDHPRAGQTVMLAIDTRPEAGWHGYWRNPGDAGFPAKFDWTLAKGATASAPQWPVPTTLLIAGLMNYVYERPYAPLVTLTVPAELAAGTALPVKLHISYLVCTSSLCVPEDQTLSLALTVGDGAATAGPAFDGWRAAIPKPLDAAATYQAKDGAVTLAVPLPASASVTDAYFFPVTEHALDYAAPQTVTRDGDRLMIATKGKPIGAIEGVLRIGPTLGLVVRAAPGAAAASGSAASTGDGWAWSALVAFAGALLGGLILNVMPCVFPILSLKALSLARANAGPREARGEALAYTGGVVMVCLGLGVAILALRAGGSSAGWAFQLQDSRSILVLLLLSVAIAFNLAGLFEVPMPRFAGRGGTGGAFMTGALAAFVATPCSGPFMGAALGAALVLPWPAAMAVFAGLGIGLALPFLLIGFIPALRARLPRPGAWMERLRRILSVPMWLTALALVWVLGRQAGVDGVIFALLLAMMLGLLLWVAGGRQHRGLSFGLLPVIGIVLVIAAGVTTRLRPAAAGPAASTVAGANAAFSEAKLNALRKEGRPVFAYFTADWCLTCKVNEKAAIETDGVRAAFAAKKVAVLVGDWTNGDPVLGRFIQAHNRAGVPLYLYYRPGAAEPEVLPQVLTPGMLEKLGG